MATNPDVLFALRCQLGNAVDNHVRAKMAFRGLSASEMQKEHGESGQTRQAVLDGYREEVERWERAIADAGGS